MRYGPFDDILKYDLASRPNHWDRDDVFDTCKYIASSVNAIIPIAMTIPADIAAFPIYLHAFLYPFQ